MVRWLGDWCGQIKYKFLLLIIQNLYFYTIGTNYANGIKFEGPKLFVLNYRAETKIEANYMDQNINKNNIWGQYTILRNF